MKFHLRLRCFLVCMCLAAVAARADYLVYFGTYTGPKSQGIYACRMDDTGKLTSLGVVAESASPAYLAVHPNKRFLYSINEVSKFENRSAGYVSAFAIDAKTGQLKELNRQSSGGPGPCHLSLDAKGQCVLVANYGGGSVQALPVKADGSLGAPGTFIQHAGSSVNKSRQEGPHGHCILPDPSQRFALACDLGLDQVLVYKLDAGQAGLTPNAPAFAAVTPGSGPRHLDFHPNGKFAYVINEMLCTVTAFAWDSGRGELKELQTISTLPGEVQRGYSTAEIYVHPSGKFVYGSNRGHNSIVGYACDPKTGRLALIGHTDTQGRTPRHFAIDPKGRFLLAENQDSGTVVVFKIDPGTGMLTATGEKAEVPSPVSAVFVPVN